MESPTRPSLSPTLSPTKVLHPVSPERMNQQGIPASPSLPSDLLSLQHKTTKGVSDVQAKVAFLNSLSRGGSPATPAQSAANHAALQRAMLGREEAESALSSVQEELSEAQSRERRISERLESLLEELHGTKERQAHERSIFEKEIRKARKEAFRAGSTLVKLQEELKHAKSETKALKDEVASERESKDKAKQEAFERAYTLAGLTEELEVLKGKLRSMEAANHSSNLQVQAHEMRKEDFGRLSLAEGDLAFLMTPRRPKRTAGDSILSPSQAQDTDSVHDATPPKRQRLSEVTVVADEPVETTVTTSEQDSELIEDLRDELHNERRRREEAEDMIHFLNIECQFERCSCRIAESQGHRYIYDADYYNQFQKPQLEAAAKAAAEAEAARQAHTSHVDLHSSHTPDAEPPLPTRSQRTEPDVKPEPTEPPVQMPAPQEPFVTFSPETGTFKTFPSPIRDNVAPRRTDSFASLEKSPAPSRDDWRNSAASSRYIESYTPSVEPELCRPIHSTHEEPQVDEPVYIQSHEEVRPTRHQMPRHQQQPARVNITKRVPLRDNGDSQSSSTVHDTPINREEALAQIRARRGRARSKQRSVSANEASGRSAGSNASTATTPGRGPRRIPNLQSSSKSENDLGERRDMSAPVRMFRR